VLTLRPVWAASQGVDLKASLGGEPKGVEFDFEVDVNLKTAPLQRPLHTKWH